MWSIKINTRGSKDQNRKYIKNIDIGQMRERMLNYSERNECHSIREKSIEFAVIGERDTLEEKEEEEEEKEKVLTHLCNITLSLLQEIWNFEECMKHDLSRVARALGQL